MAKWLHYYNELRPDLPSLGSVRLESRYMGHYYITKSAYRRAMQMLHRRDKDVKLAFRGSDDLLGEEIGIITYYIIKTGSIPNIQIIGKVEGVY